MPTSDTATQQPIDAVTERMNDPAVAASLVTLLDNAELLSTLMLGFSSLVERGDFIMDAVAEGVNDFKASGAAARPEGLPSVAEATELAGQLTAAAPVLSQLLDSALVKPEMIELLSDISEAATEGVSAARTNQTAVTGVRDMFKSLKDPDVQRGLGMIVEVARSLGRRMQ